MQWPSSKNKKYNVYSFLFYKKLKNTQNIFVGLTNSTFFKSTSSFSVFIVAIFARKRLQNVVASLKVNFAPSK